MKGKQMSTKQSNHKLNFKEGYLIPQATEVEEAVLGAILLENNKDTRFAINFLEVDDFFKLEYQHIFRAILSLYSKSDDIDLIIVLEELKKLGLLEEAGGPFGLSVLSAKVSTTTHIQTHVRILKQKSLQRKLIVLCNEKIDDAYDNTKDIFLTIDNTMFELSKMSEIIDKAESTVSAKQISKTFFEEMENENESKYLWETGDKQFDDIVGITKDKIILITGGAKHGKSKFTMAKMFNLLELYEDVAIYWVTLEDSAKDIAAGYLASKIFVKAKDIKRRAFHHSSINVIKEHLDKFDSFDITFQEQSSKSWQIATEFKNFAKNRPNKLCILIVDNILALQDREDFKGSENSMYDYIMNQMLNIRQQTKGCIIPIHHYKDAQQEESRIKMAFRPRLMDIKGTEAFRRIPNAVLMINNPGKYDDLMNEYGEHAEALRNLYIVDTGANREDKSEDSKALIRYLCNLDYNIFIEI